jgi:glycosyltransferase involved in cell wall biosynthesis
MVKNGKTGLLVSQYDADVLADAFCTLLSNPAELAIMGQMAHTHVEQRYTWARAASCICAKIGHDLDNDA